MPPRGFAIWNIGTCQVCFFVYSEENRQTESDVNTERPQTGK